MAIPKPGGGGDGVEGTLKWILGVLVFLFIAWLVTGGPERYQQLKPKPFEEPPSPPTVLRQAEPTP
jgi:hypothetical protein